VKTEKEVGMIFVCGDFLKHGGNFTGWHWYIVSQRAFVSCTGGTGCIRAFVRGRQVEGCWYNDRRVTRERTDICSSDTKFCGKAFGQVKVAAASRKIHIVATYNFVYMISVRCQRSMPQIMESLKYIQKGVVLQVECWARE